MSLKQLVNQSLVFGIAHIYTTKGNKDS